MPGVQSLVSGRKLLSRDSQCHPLLRQVKMSALQRAALYAFTRLQDYSESFQRAQRVHCWLRTPFPGGYFRGTQAFITQYEKMKLTNKGLSEIFSHVHYLTTFYFSLIQLDSTLSVNLEYVTRWILAVARREYCFCRGLHVQTNNLNMFQSCPLTLITNRSRLQRLQHYPRTFTFSKMFEKNRFSRHQTPSCS